MNTMRIRQILALLMSAITPIVLDTDAMGRDDELQRDFSGVVRPFLEGNCFECHSGEEPEAQLDLSGFVSARDVARDFATWKHVTALSHLSCGETGSLPRIA